MDTVTEGSAVPDVDAEMTALTPEDTKQNLEASDEVEHLRNRYSSVSRPKFSVQ